jgi:hypothetical protein
VTPAHSKEDLARWDRMAQRHRILRAAVAGLMTVEGSAPADIARSMRACADLVERDEFQRALTEAAAKAAAAAKQQTSAASSQEGTTL